MYMPASAGSCRRLAASWCADIITAALLILATACAPATSLVDTDYEVWVLDQSDSPGVSHGGAIYVYDAASLSGTSAEAVQPRLRVDLAAATAALCTARTGRPPTRPHMIRFNAEGSHAIIAFVASGHVVFLDARTAEPVDCISTTRSETGQQAHAAYPTPDGRFVLVANQNGKRLERIEVDYVAGRFALDSAAMIDLSTCTTPSGAPCQAPALRPDNAPVCPFMSRSGLAFVTLRGGGLLVVDVRDRPMRIVAEYDASTIKGNGCGGVEVAGHMYINAGGRPGVHDHMPLYGFDVYRFPLAQIDDRAGPLQSNAPAPAVLYSTDGPSDSHGMVATPDGRFVWVFDRHGDTAEVFDAASGSHVASVPLNGEFTDNAAPDIAAMSPTGNRIYVALRGPTPLSGDPHNATGSTPGLGVLEIDGARGRLAGIVRISNVKGGVEHADPHAVAIRRNRSQAMRD
jgi:hypothetical protein